MCWCVGVLFFCEVLFVICVVWCWVVGLGNCFVLSVFVVLCCWMWVFGNWAEVWEWCVGVFV